ncbi:MAG TPA: type II secretion system protein GspK [Longimicrobiales bacterium]
MSRKSADPFTGEPPRRAVPAVKGSSGAGSVPGPDGGSRTAPSVARARRAAGRVDAPAAATPGRRPGFALLAVLWMLVLIGAIAAGFTASTRADRLATANFRSAAMARWAARAGLARQLAALDAQLAGPGAARAMSAAGDPVIAPAAFRVDRVVVQAVTRDARARLQLNLADATQFVRLFVALGYQEDVARMLARRIIRRRELLAGAGQGVSVRRGFGAPTAEGDVAARDSSMGPLPIDGPYHDVAELRAVPGITPAVFRVIAPYLTVAGDGRINVNSATAPVLRTLPAIGQAAATALIERRRRAPFNTIFDVINALPRNDRAAARRALAALGPRIAFGPRDVEVHATASLPGAPIRAELHAVVRLVGGPRVTVLEVVER